MNKSNSQTLSSFCLPPKPYNSVRTAEVFNKYVRSLKTASPLSATRISTPRTATVQENPSSLSQHSSKSYYSTQNSPRKSELSKYLKVKECSTCLSTPSIQKETKKLRAKLKQLITKLEEKDIEIRELKLAVRERENSLIIATERANIETQSLKQQLTLISKTNELKFKEEVLTLKETHENKTRTLKETVQFLERSIYNSTPASVLAACSDIQDSFSRVAHDYNNKSSELSSLVQDHTSQADKIIVSLYELERQISSIAENSDRTFESMLFGEKEELTNTPTLTDLPSRFQHIHQLLRKVSLTVHDKYAESCGSCKLQ